MASTPASSPTFGPSTPTCPPRTLPKLPSKRMTKQAKQTQQTPPPPDAAIVRPLAKRFRPFLCRMLQLLRPLLRTNPSGAGDTEGLDVRVVILSVWLRLVETECETFEKSQIFSVDIWEAE
ncbi:hypothetical protein ZWY2020_017170 [Hordeum vulgare]|nr:hypothetical protein ZWY2020_017170 [Hordeum vulgare]